MTIVYLGIFQKVFQWVYDKILEPVINFVSGILSKVFEWLFNSVLGKILTSVLEMFFDWMTMQMKIIFIKFMYDLTRGLLLLCDLLEKGMGLFIGTESVKVQGVQVSLLEAVLQMDGVRRAFIYMTVLGLGLALILTIFAVVKSMMDLDYDEKHTVGTVMSQFLKCCVTFLGTPFIVLVILKIAAIIMQTIERYVRISGNQTVGSTIFYCITMKANPQWAKIVGTVSGAINETELMNFDSRRMDFLQQKIGCKYYSLVEVAAQFDIFKIDYTIGIIVAILMLIIMFVAILTFVRRIYEVALLYLASPLFVATMPIDNGERFSRWREMFIAKVFSGYGTILALKLYLILIPSLVANDTIKFYDTGNSFISGELDYIVKLMLVIGGAWSVMKMGPMITGLLNAQAGMSETATMAATTGFINQHVIQKGLNSVQGKLRNSTTLKNFGKSAVGGLGAMTSKGSAGQAFKGAPSGAKWKKATYPGLSAASSSPRRTMIGAQRLGKMNPAQVSKGGTGWVSAKPSASAATVGSSQTRHDFIGSQRGTGVSTYNDTGGTTTSYSGGGSPAGTIHTQASGGTSQSYGNTSNYNTEHTVSNYTSTTNNNEAPSSPAQPYSPIHSNNSKYSDHKRNDSNEFKG